METPSSSERKKVLIITYYWPPGGGGGVQRWLKFVKYLPEYGVQPIVAVPDNPEYPVRDESLSVDVNKDLEVLKIPIWEPYKLFKIFTGKKKEKSVNSGLFLNEKKKSLTVKISIWIRGNILIPDPRLFWVRPAKRSLLNYLKNNSIDTIITTGPPHSVHLIGLKLKKKTGVKWIADFRDPWSEIDYLDEFKLTRLSKNIHRRLEHNVLSKADKVITVSKHWAADLKNLGAKNVFAITNGYDEDDFKSFNYTPKKTSFTLLYSGILHDYRNPEYLWNLLEDLCTSNENFSSSFSLKLYGTIDAKVIAYLNSLPQLKDKFSYEGYIPHKQLLKEYEKASVLLLLQNNTKNALGHIPGKLFEYLAARKAILGIGPIEGDSAGIISDAKSGKVFDGAQKDKLQEHLKTLFESWEDNRLLISDSKAFTKYSRQNLTQELVKLL